MLKNRETKESALCSLNLIGPVSSYTRHGITVVTGPMSSRNQRVILQFLKLV